MKLVILDGYTENPGDLSWDGLRELAEVTVYDRTSLTDPAQTIARIADAEIVLTNKTPLPRAVFEACPNIKMVGVLATGYNVVDIACARERGIPVCNVPAYGTASVSQYAIALLLEACHHIGHHSDAVHAGRWASCPDWCFWDYPLIELEHKTIGIIGYALDYTSLYRRFDQLAHTLLLGTMAVLLLICGVVLLYLNHILNPIRRLSALSTRVAAQMRKGAVPAPEEGAKPARERIERARQRGK